MILIDVMNHVKNYFVNPRQTEEGKFTISGGIITLRGKYLIGQHLAVSGSILSSGVYLVNDDLITLDGARDETFTGMVAGLAVPPNFLRLVKEIEDFSNSREGQASNVVSASFGIQSFSFATDADGNRAGWEQVFAKRLNQFRRYTADIII